MTVRIKPETDEPVSDATLWGLWLECQDMLISGVSRFRETAEPDWRRWTERRLHTIEAEIVRRKAAMLVGKDN